MRKKVLLLFILLVLTMLQPASVLTAGPPEHSLFVVLIPGLELDDLDRYPHLRILSEKSALGLMNTGGGRRAAGAYLSLSTGTKLTCSEKEGALLFQNDETHNGLSVSSLYQRYLDRPAAADVLMPSFTGLLASAGNPAVTFLADVLNAQGIPFLFIGNQDLPGIISRPGALFAVDSAGTIKNGAVDERNYVINEASPTLYTTNYAYYYEEALRFITLQKGLVFMDLGDLARLEAVSANLTEPVYEKSRQALLQEADNFLGKLLLHVHSGEAELLILTPYPAQKALQTGDTLTPVLYCSPVSSGLLSSASTKRLGLITHLDIAPTILKLSGLDTPAPFIGAPVYTVPQRGTLTYLHLTHAGMLTNYQQRPVILKGYVFLLIASMLSIAAFVLWRRSLFHKSGPFLLFLLTGPLLFLLLPLVPLNGLFSRTVFLAFSGASLVYLLEKTLPAQTRLAVLYLVTALCVTIDLLLGAPLMQSSLLGYDAISGARYYGIGNEYMGILLGSGFIGLALLLEILAVRYPYRRPQLSLFVCAAAAILLILVAAPQWGTNVGGAISFTGSFVLLCFLLAHRKINLKSLAFLGLCCTGVAALLFMIDLQRPLEVQSHIGLTARIIHEEGFSYLLTIILRKISTNFRLLQYSLWGRAFLVFLGATALVFYKPTGSLQKLFAAHRFLQAGFTAGLTGSLIALIVNDSGIVAAATASIFIVPTLLYLISKEEQQKEAEV
ncbi:MAG: hypothetical protein RBT41_10420 [Clostridia bacterium]|nr:hypothetical protein [Clostridia bacterium]